jgi:hypothetical protein
MWSFLDLIVDSSDVFAHNSNRQELNAADKQEGRHDYGVTDQWRAGKKPPIQNEYDHD